MKKSEFEKLQLGDVVTLRTLDELKQLKCYSGNGVRDDEGYFWSYLEKVRKEVLGREGVVIYVSSRRNEIEVEIDGNEFYVVRQHLKGGK